MNIYIRSFEEPTETQPNSAELEAAIADVNRLHDQVVRAHADPRFPQRTDTQVFRPLYRLAQALDVQQPWLSPQTLHQIAQALIQLLSLESLNVKACEEVLRAIKRSLTNQPFSRFHGELDPRFWAEMDGATAEIDTLIASGRTRRKVARNLTPPAPPSVDYILVEAERMLAAHIFKGPVPVKSLN